MDKCANARYFEFLTAYTVGQLLEGRSLDYDDDDDDDNDDDDVS